MLDICFFRIPSLEYLHVWFDRYIFMCQIVALSLHSITVKRPKLIFRIGRLVMRKCMLKRCTRRRKRLMKKKRVFAIGSLLTTVMLSLLLLTAPTTSAVGTFGAIQGLSHHHLVAAKKAIPIRAYGISTQRAQALAMQFSKGKITTRSLRRMQHRVQQQLPIKATK